MIYELKEAIDLSEPKLVSPLLDGFIMGAPMSDHNGIRCCPAMKENSDEKYIVKVISIPASQVQLDALLLTGAYKDPAAAMDYFKELSDGIVQEAELLQKLSKLEGFLPYESWQIVPQEENHLGYDVYLLSSYRQSLEKFLRRNSMTHLGAVNLGLDMCAALAICRNAGYLYADLRPANIYISEDKEYRIGDLGFISLASLKYASLPEKYLSPYTPPELHDPMATVNTTADIYAVGMVLYQIYNNGVLPFQGKAPAEELPSPVNADYEIAEIIMKAIAPDVASRWQNPIEMGQALVSYMQRNVINDVPISPPLASVGVSIAPEPEVKEAEAPQAEDAPVSETDTPASDETAEQPDAPDNTESPAMPEDAEEDTDDIRIPELTPALQDASDDAENAPGDDRKTMVIPASQTPSKPRFTFFEDDEDEDDFDDEELTEDESEKAAATPEVPRPPRKKKTGLVIMMVVLLLVAALCYGGYYYYSNIYQLNINELSVSGEKNEIYVTVDTDVDPSLLTVVCSDSYGNTKRMALTDSKATFTDLSPDTMYQIQLEVSGYHEIVGPKSSSYTTSAETRILNFTGITGNADGTVVLSFSVEGPESEWILRYSAEDEEEKSVTFSGHTVNVADLTVGKTYTFTLEPTTQLYIVTDTSIEFTASSLILAEELEITACSGGTLTAQWVTPADTTVESWNVLCYGDGGYNVSAVTSENTITFENIDPAQAYTVEVTAAGMTQPVRTSITANPITVGELHVDESDPEKLVFTWDYEGNAPESGWLLMYTIDGGEDQFVVQAATNSAEVSPRIPGADYTVTILSADATTIFTEEHIYSCPDAEIFDGYGITSKLLKANMLVTPKAGWSYRDVRSKDYTTSFKLGEKISILLRSPFDFWLDRDDIRILYVVRDGDGNVLTDLTAQDTGVWYNLWFDKKDYHYCELDLPNVPQEAGTYTVFVYFNGYIMCEIEFTISE